MPEQLLGKALAALAEAVNVGQTTPAEVIGRRSRDACQPGSPGAQSGGDARGDFVLDREQVLQAALPPLGLELKAAARVDELRGDA